MIFTKIIKKINEITSISNYLKCRFLCLVEKQACIQLLHLIRQNNQFLQWIFIFFTIWNVNLTRLTRVISKKSNCIKNIKSNQSGEVKHKTSEPIERVMHIVGKMTINPADPTIPLNIFSILTTVVIFKRTFSVFRKKMTRLKSS